MFDISKSAGFESIQEYINKASGSRGDTRRDRRIALFKQLRENINEQTWHRVPGVRTSTQTYAYENSYIPVEVGQKEAFDKKTKADPQKFIEQWTANGLEFENLNVDVNDFFKTILSNTEVASNFVKNNLHDTDYFFTKFAEWHTTILLAKTINANRIIDLGAAYHGFAYVAREKIADLEIIMSDLLFPAGIKELSDRVFRHGANASKLTGIEDDSIDIVCAHNAFEHFSGGADIGCLGEIERVLKPGGMAVITPFQGTETHTLTINPFSSFVTNSEAQSFEDDLLEEIQSENAAIRYNLGMISSFARTYDFESAQRRLLNSAPGLKPILRQVHFLPDGFDSDGLSIQSYKDLRVRKDVFESKNFWILALQKQ